MMPLLAPLFQGDWTAYGEALACAPCWPADALPVTRLIGGGDGGLLPGVMRRHAAHLGVRDGDLRAAASSWSLDYLGALLPAAAAAASLLQHRLPLRADEMALSLDQHGAPVRFHILHEGSAMPGSPTATRYGPMLDQHLAPLFDAIHRHTRLPHKILWANAARHLDAIFAQALDLSGNAAPVALDRDMLLRRAAGADGRANPLHGRQRRVVPAGPTTRAETVLHRECCLMYRLPEQSWCGACPLAPHHAPAV